MKSTVKQRRITLFSTARLWGGAEQQTWLLAEGLRSRGWCVAVVARRGSSVARRMESRRFSTLTVSGTGRNLWSLMRTRRRLRSTRPDIIHFVDPHGVTLGGLASLGMPSMGRVAVRHNPFPLRMPARYRWFCDRVICISSEIAAVCRSAGLPHKMLRVVLNGCPEPKIVTKARSRIRSELGLASDAFVVLTVAMLNECKGHRYLLDAFAAFASRVPGSVLLLAGDGPLEKSLRDQAQRLGIGSRIAFLGYRTDVPELMQAADLCVSPSVEEGMGVARIEAMLASCPLVTTSAGMADLTDAGDGKPFAWIVPPADARMLAEAMAEAAGSAEERLRRAWRARHLASEQLSWDAMVERTMAVYGELIGPADARMPRAA